MRSLIPRICLLALTAALLPGPVQAQSLSRQLEEVRRLVEEKNYANAIEDLKFIARQVQELRISETAFLFPDAPEGWEAGEAISNYNEEDLWSRRLSVRRSYRPSEGGRVDLVYDFHSPLIPSVAISLNPVYIAGDPSAESVPVGKGPGRLVFNSDTGEGELLFILQNRVLVSITGRGVPSRDTILLFRSLIDLAALGAYTPR